MHIRKRQRLLPGQMLLAGVLGMGLRLLLNGYCTDYRLLLPTFHPLGVALGLLTAAALGLALYASIKMGKAPEAPEAAPASFQAFWGHLLAALGIGLTLLGSASEMHGSLGLVWKGLACASIPCLIAAGWLRLQGKQPVFLLHLCPCLYLVAHTIGQYQRWSSDPQLLNYIFPLLGIISMVFFAFYHSTFDAGFSWKRRLNFCGLAAICLGIMALPGCSYPWLYLGMVLWALTDLPEPSEVEDK